MKAKDYRGWTYALSITLFTSLVMCLSFQPTQASVAKLRVAVLDFTNASSERDMDPLSQALQSMVTTDLAQAQGIQLIERSRLKDILAELRLSHSRLIDPASASRLGKLVGATHLVAGSYAVVGERMRLDCRLFTVEGGTVLLSDSAEGQKSSFFALEKELLRRMSETIEKLGVTIAPKERAAMAQIHTTDFEALRKYGVGVHLFDEKKYSEALSAMKEASRIDTTFRLAEYTVSDYEKIISSLLNKAEQIEERTANVRQQEKNLFDGKTAEMLSLLNEKASDNSKSKQTERLAALLLLSSFYEAIHSGHDLKGHPIPLDSFAAMRLSARFYQRYWTEAKSLVPHVPVSIGPFEDEFPSNALENFPRHFSKFTKELSKYKFFSNRYNRTICMPMRSENMIFSKNLENKLYLDAMELGAIRSIALKKIQDAACRETDHQGDFLKFFRKGHPLAHAGTNHYVFLDLLEREPILAFDRKLELIKQVIENTPIGEGRVKALRWGAEEIKKIMLQKQQYEALPQPRSPTTAELFWRQQEESLDPVDPGEAFIKCELGERDEKRQAGCIAGLRRINDWADPLKKLEQHTRRKLTNQRSHKNREFSWLISAHPVWKFGGSRRNLSTGPQPSVPYRSNELRYYDAKRLSYKEAGDSIVVFDGCQRSELVMSFQLVNEIPDDFEISEYPSFGAELDKTLTPEIGILFATRDLENRSVPLQGYAVMIGKDQVRLVEVRRRSDKADSSGKETDLFPLKMLAEQKRKVAGKKQTSVRFTLKKSTIELNLDGESYNFRAPAQSDGFYGLLFRGYGYSEVKDISISDVKLHPN